MREVRFWGAQVSSAVVSKDVQDGPQTGTEADEPEATREILKTMAAGGTTTVSARFIHHSLAHYLEQIHALVELNEDQT